MGPGSPGASKVSESKLRREVTFVGAAAVSIALMGPTAAMSLNPILPAQLVGRAVPLVFLVATIGVGLVAWGFIRLSQQFNHSGSVYAFAGVTLGPRAGFFSGWAILLTYILYATTTMAAAGIFAGEFLQRVGVWEDPSWLTLAGLAAVLVTVLAYNEVRFVTRALLTLEGVSVVAVLVLMVIVVARLASGAPDGQTFDFAVFSPAEGTTGSTIFLAVVFGFLSYAGFESAASLGEETQNPQRDIPKALIATVVGGGLFFMLVATVMSMGFGTDAAGVATFAGSSSALSDLAQIYAGDLFGDVIVLGAAIGAIGSCLACATAGSRMLYSFGRVGFVDRRLAVVSARTGAPLVALAIVIGLAVATLLVLWFAATDEPFDVFAWTATVGTFPLLIAYLMTTVGAAMYVATRRLTPRWELVFPAFAVAFIGYVLWKNVSPVPAHPYNLFPYIAVGWMVIGAAIAFLVPSLTRRIGRELSSQLAADA